MTLFIIGLAVFLGIHTLRVAAPGLRASLMASMGANPFRGVYSLIAILSLVLLIYGFGNARQETGILYDPPAFLRPVTFLLMLVALTVYSAGFLPSGHIAASVKHPQVLGIKIWAFAHLLVNGETAQVILFAAFLAWGVVMRIAYKRRTQRGEITERSYKSWTYDIAAIVIGVAVYGLFVWKLHALLIGIPVTVT